MTNSNLENIFLLILKELDSKLRIKGSEFFIQDTFFLDKLCQELGSIIFRNNSKISADFLKNPINKNLNIYMTGAVFKAGGHTREIEDWIENIYSDRKNILFITSKLSESHAEALEKFRLLNVEIIHSDISSNVARIEWIQSKLAELRPEVIFVSTTNHDIFSLAALQEELVNKLYWNLSLDHGVSIGMHLKAITKIIVKRPYLYFYLQEKKQFKNLLYIPFNRPDFVGKLENYVSTDESKPIVTASCTSASSKIENPYKYKFIEIVANLLKITDGYHIHFGAISEDALDELNLIMKDIGVSKDRFIVIKFVESLAKALIENNVDILIQTFPSGGGLVSIEAMEAGKMIVNHKNSESDLSNLSDFCYNGALNWQQPDELYEFFRGLTRQEIVRQSKISRAHYLKYNCLENLKNFMNINNICGIDIDNLKEEIFREYENFSKSDNIKSSINNFNCSSFDQEIPYLKRKLIRVKNKIKKSFKKRFKKLINKFLLRGY